MYRLATNRTGKKLVEENANGIETDNQACTGRVTFCYLLPLTVNN